MAPGPDLDVLDPAALAASVGEAAPEVIYHLAALTHVGRSWDDPSATFTVNALGTLHLLEAASACAVPPVVVLISSAEVYGPALDDHPLDEQAELRPYTPYAVSKVAAEYLGVQAHLGRGLRVVRARPFNHVGPGQSDDFVVGALARRMVEAELHGLDTVAVGNLSASRDFTDVRDVVRAYRMLAIAGEPAEAYNVCSGNAITIAALAEAMAAELGSEVKLVEDPELFRPVDVPVLLGDGAKLAATTGWRPEIPLAETLRDVLEHSARPAARSGSSRLAAAPTRRSPPPPRGGEEKAGFAVAGARGRRPSIHVGRRGPSARRGAPGGLDQAARPVIRPRSWSRASLACCTTACAEAGRRSETGWKRVSMASSRDETVSSKPFTRSATCSRTSASLGSRPPLESRSTASRRSARWTWALWKPITPSPTTT